MNAPSITDRAAFEDYTGISSVPKKRMKPVKGLTPKGHSLLASGFYVNISNFTVADVRLKDIVGALAKTCRYGGQCKKFYSVAQHSVILSKFFEAMNLTDEPSDLAKAAMLHDMTEAYINDVPRPIKNKYFIFVKLWGWLPWFMSYSKFEEKIGRVIFEAFGVDYDDTMDRLAPSDSAICLDEMAVLMPDVDNNLSKRFAPLGVEIKPVSPFKAERLFKQRLRELFSKEVLNGLR